MSPGKSRAEGREPEGKPAPGEAKPTPPSAANPERKSDPVKRLTWVVLTLVLLLFVWYVLADRHAPWTDQARAEVAKAAARVKSAEAGLEKAKGQLGADGEDNARIRCAIGALEREGGRDLISSTPPASQGGRARMSSPGTSPRGPRS